MKKSMRLGIIFFVVLGISISQSCSMDKDSKDAESNVNIAARNTIIEDIEEVFKQEVSYGEVKRVTYESTEYFYEEVLNSSGIVIGYVDENEGKYGVSDIRSSNYHRYVNLKNNKEYIFGLNYSDTYNVVIPDFESFTSNQANEMFSDGNDRCMGNFMLCLCTGQLL